MSQSFVVARLSLNEEETEPVLRPVSEFAPGPYFLTFLSRPCGRPIAFTETFPASAIPPLDETGSKVFAAAIATDQPV
jgi:hypothetical protein